MALSKPAANRTYKRVILNKGKEQIAMALKKNPKKIQEVEIFLHIHQGLFDPNSRKNRISLESKYLQGIGKKVEAVLSGSLEFVVVKDGSWPVFIQKNENGDVEIVVGGPRSGYKDPLSMIVFSAYGAREFMINAKWIRNCICELSGEVENASATSATSSSRQGQSCQATDFSAMAKQNKGVRKPWSCGGKRDIRMSDTPPPSSRSESESESDSETDFPRKDSEENLPDTQELLATLKSLNDDESSRMPILERHEAFYQK